MTHPDLLYTKPNPPHVGNDFTNHFYHYIPNFLSESEVMAARGIFDAYDSTPGQIGLNHGETYVERNDIRKCGVTHIQRDETNHWLHEKMEQVMLQTNDQLWKLSITDFGETMRQMRYGPDEHFRAWHVDHGAGDTAFRKLTAVVQLSHESEYEGGDFEFAGNSFDDEFGKFYYPNINTKQMGSILIFPTYFFHRVTTISKGDRRSAVFRACGPYFR